MTDRPRDELLAYAIDAVRILQEAVHLQSEEQRYFYRVAAVELRLLFCDTTRVHERLVPLALAGRLWPDLRLPSLSESLPEGSLLLNEWLEQKLPEGDLTIRQLIRRVCDQDGGAHVDARLHARLPEGFQPEERICELSEIALAVLIPLLRKETGKF